MNQVLLLTYHRTEQIDYDWLKLCLSSFKRHCTARIIIVTDNMPKLEHDIIRCKYDAAINTIPSSEWDGRRMLCRLEQTNNVIQDLSSEDTQLLQSDIDVLFLSNPFKVFDEHDFGIGVTVRMYSYHVPVNSGLVFFKVDDGIK